MNLTQAQLSELAFQKLIHLTKQEPHFRAVMLTTFKLVLLEWAEKHSHFVVDEEIDHFVVDFWKHLSGVEIEEKKLILVKS